MNIYVPVPVIWCILKNENKDSEQSELENDNVTLKTCIIN